MRGNGSRPSTRWVAPGNLPDGRHPTRLLAETQVFGSPAYRPLWSPTVSGRRGQGHEAVISVRLAYGDGEGCTSPSGIPPQSCHRLLEARLAASQPLLWFIAPGFKRC